MQRVMGAAAPLVESEFGIQEPCQCKVCGFFFFLETMESL